MRDFLVIEVEPVGSPSLWRSAEARVLAVGGWRKVAERRTFSVFLEIDRPPPFRHLPGTAGALIGEVFDSAAAREGQGEGLDWLGMAGAPDDIAWRLINRGFGRYVAIFSDDHGAARVLRDPMGAQEVIGWRRDGLRFIGSRLPEALPELWPEDLAIDGAALAAILRQKNLASHLLPLKGLVNYEPGVLSRADGRGVRLWSPERFAARQDRDLEPEDLRRRLDGVLGAWTQGREGRGGVFCEISGGLDSAIVATSLARTGAPPLFGVNHAFPQAEADERRHAQAIADHIGVPLVVVDRPLLTVAPEKFLAGAGGSRPNYVGGDPDYDADLAARLAQSGIEAVFTGRGGDAVLYQPPDSGLVRDVLAGRCDVGRRHGLERLARRRMSTVWTLVRLGLRPRDGRRGAGLTGLLSPDLTDAAPALHPWLAAAAGLDPARQAQILGVVNNLSAFGESQRHRAGEVIDPWLSQPIFELCLSIPVGRLAVGPCDRPFARAAFADRLPAQALAREGKGNLTTFFARSLGQSLDHLRPWLLEGELVQAGFVDRARLEATLSRDHLIWASATAELFILIAIEAWTRRWRERIQALQRDPLYRAGVAGG